MSGMVNERVPAVPPPVGVGSLPVGIGRPVGLGPGQDGGDEDEGWGPAAPRGWPGGACFHGFRILWGDAKQRADEGGFENKVKI